MTNLYWTKEYACLLGVFDHATGISWGQIPGAPDLEAGWEGWPRDQPTEEYLWGAFLRSVFNPIKMGDT